MKRDKKLVVFLPDWSEGNPYLNSLADALSEHGFTVVMDDYSKNLLPLSSTAKKHPAAGVIHLHWIAPLANRYYWSRNPMKRLPKFVLYYLVLMVDVWLTRKKGVRLMWTVHNLYTHEARYTWLELKIRRLLAKRADGIFFHSHEAAKLAIQEYGVDPGARIAITPHACYGAFYDDRGKKSVYGESGSEVELGTFTYLFFGNVRRYKGLESLVHAFKRLDGKHLRLIVAGKVFEKKEEAWLLEEVARDPRIVFVNGFVPEENVAGLIQSSDVVVLPFVRTLSSGSALLAITYGRPLILPESARVFGVPGDGGAIYFNGDYSLEQAMREAAKADLTAYRQHNYRLADELTWEAMAKTMEKSYLK